MDVAGESGSESTAMALDWLPMQRSRTEGWAAMRALGEVFTANGAWFVTGSEPVEFALKHPELFSSAQAFDSLGSPLRLVPIAFDPPDHARFRRILDPLFAPRRIAAVAPELRALAGELIDGIAARGECDVVADLAIPYPSDVFLTLFGLPLEDRDRLIAWKDAVIAAASPTGKPPPEGPDVEAAIELFGYLNGYIGERRAQGPTGDDVLSRIIDLGDDGLTDEELLGLAFLFVLAGLDTVTAVIGFAFLNLAQQPDLRAAIVADPAIIPTVVEEILRLELPAPLVPRIATEDVELGGCRIAAGAPVNVVLACPNRDAAEHPDPDSIVLGREDARHLGFGGGVHRCLGSHLARAELRLILEEFHRRIPDYSLAPGAEPQVAWPSGTLGLDTLPLVFGNGSST
jgi:cytochrome P450